MAKTTQSIEVPASRGDIPAGLLPDDGVSPKEAADGLFEMLGSEDEFSEEPISDGEEAAPDDDDEESEDDGESEELDDEGEDDEPEDDSDEDESEDGDEADSNEEALYEVTLPGGEKAQVSLDELRAGYSRTEDYTRKRQRDAAEHSQMLEETRSKRDAYAAGLEKLEATLRELGPKKPDATLRKSNPGEYAAQMAEYNEFEMTLNEVGTAKGYVQAEMTEEQLEATKNYVSAEWDKVVVAVPEWQDTKRAQTDLLELREFAKNDLGFTDVELDNLADSRLLLMLKENHDLKRARDTGKQKVEQRKKSSKKLVPGAANRQASRKQSAKKQRRMAEAKAAQTGSVTDAARAIELALAEEDF